MSYNVYPYLIDIEELRRAFGSGDERIIDKIKSRSSDEIERHDEWFKSEIVEGAPRLEGAMKEIIGGQIASPEFAFQYGYALQMLCGELGVLLPSGTFCDSRVIFELPFALPIINNGPPVPIPPIRDFPSIGHLLPMQFETELEKHTKPEAELSDNTFDQMRLDYVEWLEEAQRSKKGLVGFCC